MPEIGPCFTYFLLQLIFSCKIRDIHERQNHDCWKTIKACTVTPHQLVSTKTLPGPPPLSQRMCLRFYFCTRLSPPTGCIHFLMCMFTYVSRRRNSVRNYQPYALSMTAVIRSCGVVCLTSACHTDSIRL